MGSLAEETIVHQPDGPTASPNGLGRAVLGALLCSTLILTGCGIESDSGRSTNPEGLPSEPDPDAPAIEATLVQRSDGLDLVLTYPDPGMPPDRAVVLYLQQQVAADQDWKTSYTLYGPRGEGTEPSFAEGYADEVPDSLVRGSGPDRFVVPTLSHDSTYRVCRDFIVGEPPRSRLGCSQPFAAGA